MQGSGPEPNGFEGRVGLFGASGLRFSVYSELFSAIGGDAVRLESTHTHPAWGTHEAPCDTRSGSFAPKHGHQTTRHGAIRRSLGLLAHLLRFGWGGCQGGLTAEPEEMGQEP